MVTVQHQPAADFLKVKRLKMGRFVYRVVDPRFENLNKLYGCHFDGHSSCGLHNKEIVLDLGDWKVLQERKEISVDGES